MSAVRQLRKHRVTSPAIRNKHAAPLPCPDGQTSVHRSDFSASSRLMVSVSPFRRSRTLKNRWFHRRSSTCRWTHSAGGSSATHARRVSRNLFASTEYLRLKRFRYSTYLDGSWPHSADSRLRLSRISSMMWTPSLMISVCQDSCRFSTSRPAFTSREPGRGSLHTHDLELRVLRHLGEALSPFDASGNHAPITLLYFPQGRAVG